MDGQDLVAIRSHGIDQELVVAIIGNLSRHLVPGRQRHWNLGLRQCAIADNRLERSTGASTVAVVAEGKRFLRLQHLVGASPAGHSRAVGFTTDDLGETIECPLDLLVKTLCPQLLHLHLPEMVVPGMNPDFMTGIRCHTNGR